MLPRLVEFTAPPADVLIGFVIVVGAVASLLWLVYAAGRRRRK